MYKQFVNDSRSIGHSITVLEISHDIDGSLEDSLSTGLPFVWVIGL